VVQDFSHTSTVSLIDYMCIWIYVIYGNSSNLMTIKLDASDDRRINSVREDIKGFAEKNAMCTKSMPFLQHIVLLLFS